MKLKRFRYEDQQFLRTAYNLDLIFALVERGSDKGALHTVIGVACCMSHLIDEDGEYVIVSIPDIKGFIQ